VTYVLLVVSFALLLGGALIFTNAVEWAGVRLDLGAGAVGSILAAVATALPESLIPIIALVSGSAESEAVAIGAIVGGALPARDAGDGARRRSRVRVQGAPGAGRAPRAARADAHA
jgi:hypothetical protein